MALGDIKAGRAFVEVYADTKRLTRSLRGIGTQMKAFGAGISAMGMKTAAAGAALAGPMVLATRHFMRTGDQLDKMSGRVGVSVEFLSQLSHAAELGGTDIGKMEVGIRRLQRSAYDASRGLSTQVDAFNDLGISATDVSGKLKGTEGLFMETVGALSKVENETKRAALANAIFGRSGTALLPMLKDGKEGMLAAMEEAKRLGIVMSTEDATAAAKFTDAMTRVWSVTKMVFFRIGAAVADSGIADGIANIVTNVHKFVKQNKALIQTVAKVAAGLLAGGLAFVVVGKSIAIAGSALLGLFTAAQFAATGLSIMTGTVGLLLNPITLFAAGIAAASAGILYLARNTTVVKGVRSTLSGYATSISAMFSTLASDVSDAWGGITNAIKAGRIDLAWKVITSTMKLEWARVVAFFREKMGPFVEWWRSSQEAIGNILIDTVAVIKKAWAEMVGWLQKKWLTFANSNLSKNLFEMMTPLLKVIGIEVSQGAIDEAWKQSRNKLPSDIAAIDKQTDAAKDAADSDRKAASDALAADMERKRKADADSIAAAKNEVEAARRARAAALDEAADAAKVADEARAKKKATAVEDSAEAVETDKGGAVGTFSGTALSQMAGPASPLVRINKSMDDKLKKIAALEEASAKHLALLKLEAAP